MAKITDLTGMRFGMLVVINRASDYVSKNGNKAPRWNCVCDCGNKTTVLATRLICGRTTSCGCYKIQRIKETNTTHGGCKVQERERLYWIWVDIRRRCLNVDRSEYNNYGGRGIKVCEEWKDSYSVFREWALSTGYDEYAPRGQCTIDRIDVNGDYCPENCRWANAKEQGRNRRYKIPDVEYLGEKHSISEWCDIVNIPYNILYSRIKRGWDIKRAFTEPVNH